MNKKLLVILIVIFTSSIQGIIARISYERGNLNPFSYSMNVLFVSLIIFTLVFLAKHESLKDIPKFLWKKLFILGILATVIAMGLYYVGLNYTTAINTSFIVRLQAPFTALFAFFMLSERPSKRQTIALVLMFLGAYLIIFKLALIKPNVGDIIMVISAAILGFTNCYFKRDLSNKLPISKILFVRNLFGVPILIILVSLFIKDQAFSALYNQPFLVSLQALFYCVYMFSFYYSIREIGAGMATMFLLIAPLITVVLAYFILSESFIFVQMIGAALVLIGSYLIINRTNLYWKQIKNI